MMSQRAASPPTLAGAPSAPPTGSAAEPAQAARPPSFWRAVLRDWDVHGRTLASRSLWALTVYRFGRWSMTRRSAVVQRATSRAYGVLNSLSKWITGVHLERETEIGEIGRA